MGRKGPRGLQIPQFPTPGQWKVLRARPSITKQPGSISLSPRTGNGNVLQLGDKGTSGSTATPQKATQ